MQRLVVLILLSVAMVGVLEPCTIFTSSRDGRTLVGNNEDWEDQPTRAWFLPAEGDTRGMVLFGFINGWAQGGMNDQGLFFDWVAGYETGWTRTPDLPDYFENISEKILEEASTVEEALALCAAFNVEGFRTARMMLVDRYGDSAVVGFEEGRLRIWQTDGDVQTIGAKAETAGHMLNTGDLVSVDGFTEILTACRLRGVFQTRYSNVYDLENRVVHVASDAHGEQMVALDLETELAKGRHYYDLKEIVDQLDQPPRVDHKTEPRMEISSETFGAVSGTYRGSKTSLDAVRIGGDGGQLYLWPVAGQARKFRLDPVAGDGFVLRSMAGRFTLVRDADDTVTGLLMVQAGHSTALEKID